MEASSGGEARRLAFHPVHQLMSRTGSYPLHTALELVQRFSCTGSIVVDPFCGRGTSLLAARVLQRSAYGVDTAPEAVICTAAKLADVRLVDVLDYIDDLPVGGVDEACIDPAILTFFDPCTLQQVLCIRDRLLADVRGRDQHKCHLATFALAALLGILHGHASYSLSIPSAHAYSMSWRYVGRYAEAHGLRPPKRDVRDCLRRKVARVLTIELPPPVQHRVVLGSALNVAELLPELDGRVDLVLTSPPYLNAQTYAKDNWLRLWLMGHDYRHLQATYLQTGSVTKYGALMAEALGQFRRILRPGGVLVCIAGDVRRANVRSSQSCATFRTGEFLAELCTAADAGFCIETLEPQSVKASGRYYHALSRSNGHVAADCVERVLVARRL